MRKGSYSLAGLVFRELGKDPLKGEVFIFLSHSRRQIKILCFEGDGYGLYGKKLEKGTYERPAVEAGKATLTAIELRFLMEGIELGSISRRPRYSASVCA
jgi:transposase